MAHARSWLAVLGQLAPAAAAAGIAVLILVACALIGYSLLPQRWRVRSRTAVPLALSLGCTSVGWVAWVAGVTLGTATILPIFIVLSLQAVRSWRGFIAAATRWWRAVWMVASSQPVLAIVLGLALLALIPQLLLPVTDSDGLRYHLGLPKLFLLTGRIFYYPYEPSSASPQLAEMLYLIGLKLGSAQCAKFIHAGMFLAALATLVLAVHRGRRSRVAAMLAALAFAATPAALAIVAAAFIDHVAVFHVAASLLLAASGAPPLALGCAVAGALGTKLTTAPAVAAIVLIVVVRARPGRRLRTLLAGVWPGVLVLLPFAIRNLAATGDPLFPLGHVLLGIPLPAELGAAATFTTQYHASVRSLLGITWGAAQQSAGSDEIAGWHCLLALFGLALVTVDRRLRLFAAPVVAYLVLAPWLHPPTRYLLPMLLALAAVGALALSRLPKRIATWLGLVIVAPGLVTGVVFVLNVFSPFDYILGKSDRPGFLARAVPGYRAAEIVNAQPSGGVVMALGFPAPFYFDRPWIAEGMMVVPPLETWLRSAHTADDVLQRLRAADVRLLVVCPNYGGGTPQSLLLLAHSPEMLQRIVDLRARLAPIASVDGVDVFAVPR